MKKGSWRNITIFGTSLGAAVIFFAAGIVFWGGFHTVVEATNTMWFCTSCHEMSHVYEEYQQRNHYQNPTGVGATCSDCHVPDAWGPKMVRKVVASRELYHKALGSINTEEKFEAKRQELAERVWRSMIRTDSRECRNCHNWTNMDMAQQSARAVREHERGFAVGQTCIDCHQGIAHELPDAWDESPVWERRFAEVDELRASYQRAAAEAVAPKPAEPEVSDNGVAAEVATRPAPQPEPAPADDVAEREVTEVAGDALASALDWSGIPALSVELFLTGQASIEWVQDGSQHGGGRAFGFGDRCVWCHLGEESDIGKLVITGEKLETKSLGNKRGHVPMQVQAAHDDDYLYMRFQWQGGEHAPLPFVDGGRMDPENEVKLTVSFADDRVDMADRGGCWASCHHDSAYMPDAPDAEALDASGLGSRIYIADGITKYLSESRTDIEIRGRRGAPRGGWDKLRTEEEIQTLLDDGIFLDLARFKSGGGGVSESGFVLKDRRFTDSDAVVFSSERDGDTWVVYMTRALKPGNVGDINMSLDGKYNIGFALHDDHSASRFHHVSWQYGLVFDAEVPGDFDDDLVELNATRVQR
jgi:nitrate/TMAO reductase-like tetraheme cytochrome c subunit